MFDRRHSSQQPGEAFRQLADSLGRGPVITNPSFTTQLTHVDNLFRPAQRPYPASQATSSLRPLFGSFRNTTPAGDFPIRVEKRSARRNIDPAVWEIDDGLKAAWRAHLEGQRKGST
jgi:hypothetical protein